MKTDYDNPWLYEGNPFLSDDIGDYIGFVYCITDLSNGKKYIGKKTFKSRRKLPPLKGKSRRRSVEKETDWQDYYGSSGEVKQLVEQNGKENYKREIIHLCHKKGEMGYIELYCQIQLNALLREDFYNGICQAKIHKSHVKSITPEVLNNINGVIDKIDYKG